MGNKSPRNSSPHKLRSPPRITSPRRSIEVPDVIYTRDFKVKTEPGLETPHLSDSKLGNAKTSKGGKRKMSKQSSQCENKPSSDVQIKTEPQLAEDISHSKNGATSHNSGSDNLKHLDKCSKKSSRSPKGSKSKGKSDSSTELTGKSYEKKLSHRKSNRTSCDKSDQSEARKCDDVIVKQEVKCDSSQKTESGKKFQTVENESSTKRSHHSRRSTDRKHWVSAERSPRDSKDMPRQKNTERSPSFSTERSRRSSDGVSVKCEHSDGESNMGEVSLFSFHYEQPLLPQCENLILLYHVSASGIHYFISQSLKVLFTTID